MNKNITTSKKNKKPAKNKLPKSIPIVSIASTERNINDRKQMEEELKKCEIQLKEVQNLAKIGYWECDVLTREAMWSEEVYAVMGYRTDVSGEKTGWKQLMASIETYVFNIIMLFLKEKG